MLVDGESVGLLEYSYVSSRMGTTSLSATLRHERCLDGEWVGREFVDFRGVRLFLDHRPASRKDNTDARYVHTLEFRAGRDILLSGVYFCDAVAAGAASAGKPQSNSYDVKFFGTLDEFVQRFNDVLSYRGLSSRFSVSLEAGIAGTTESLEVSFSNATLFEALRKAVEVWEVPFYFVGDSAVFGSADAESLVEVEYGGDKELLSVSMNARNEKIVTRISGSGGTDNVPYYYPNPSPKGELGVGGTAVGVTVSDQLKFCQKVGQGDVLTYMGREAVFGGSELVFGGQTGQSAPGGVTAVVQDVLLDAGLPFTASVTGDVSGGFDRYLRLDLYANVGNTEQIPGNTTLYYFKSYYDQGGYKYEYVPREGSEVAAKGFELTVDRVEVSFGLSGGRETKSVDSYVCEYDDVAMSEEDAGIYPERRLRRVSVDMAAVVASLPSGADVTGLTVRVVGRLAPRVLWQVKNGSRYDWAQFFCETMSVTGAFDPCGWYRGDEPLGDDLSVVGLSQSGSPVEGTTITQVVLGYITPTGRLMPGIYRSSSGASRFYDAQNNTYIDPETGDYYEFENEYDALEPHEHVEDFDDVIPSIRNLQDGQGNPLNVLNDVWFDDGYNTQDVLADGETLKYQWFFVKLKPLGFNLFDCAIEDGEMAVVMSDGPCAGCHFKIMVTSTGQNPVQRNNNGTLKKENGFGVIDPGNIQPAQQDTTSNAVWVALYLDDSTFGGTEVAYGVMPAYDKASDAGPKPVTGNAYTLENIMLPPEFFTAAEEELDRRLIAFMAEHNADKYDPSVVFSRVWLAHNPAVRAALSERSRLSLTYDGTVYAPLYVSQFTVNVKEGEPLPEILVETSDIVEAKSSGLDDRIDAAVGQALNVAKGLGGGTDVKETDGRYLRKDTDDAAKEKIVFEKGLEVGAYKPGLGGIGGTIYTNGAGEAIAEVDFLTVRRKATFTQVEVDALRKVSGTILLSLAEMTCSAVEEVSGGWKCWFKSDAADGSALENGFAVGDQAVCRTFMNNDTHYYWRLVTEVGADYIVLSASDCDAGSDEPRVGDVIVQLGNRTDSSRQSAQVLDCYGAESPSYQVYAGINSYTLSGKDIFGVVYRETSAGSGVYAPHFYNYGSMYLGGTGVNDDYLSFVPGTGMTIKANVVFKAGQVIPGLSDLDYLKEALPLDEDATLIQGGLILSKTIALTDALGNVQSGINGVPSLSSIAAWYGGPMADKEATPAPQSYAKSLFRFDGSGYLAGGKITWASTGAGSIPGVSWSADGSSIVIDGSVKLASVSGDTVTELLADLSALPQTYVDFVSAQTITGVKTFTNGIKIGGATLTWVAGSGNTPGHLHIDQALVSAGDQIVISGTPGGGGGGGGASNLYNLLDVYGHEAEVVKRADGTAVGNGDLLSYNGTLSAWVALTRTDLFTGYYTSAQTDSAISTAISALNLGAAATYGIGSVASGNNGLVTGGAVWTAIDNLPEPMVFKGSLGTGGTITALPVNGTASVGDTYKVITAGTYAGQTAKVGDTFICQTKTSSANTWVWIPSGDEPEGTVTSVGLTLPTGLTLDTVNGSASPITGAGTFKVAFASGYSIPLSADVAKGVTAYNSLSDYVPKATAVTVSANHTFSTGLTLNTASSWSNTDRALYFSAADDMTNLRYYNVDSSKGLTYNPYTGALKAGKFVMNSNSGGFLKADGTEDTTTYVPSTRTVNGKALSSNVTLTLDDVDNGSSRSLANYVLKAGDTMTGALTIANNDDPATGEVRGGNIILTKGTTSLNANTSAGAISFYARRLSASGNYRNGARIAAVKGIDYTYDRVDLVFYSSNTTEDAATPAFEEAMRIRANKAVSIASSLSIGTTLSVTGNSTMSGSLIFARTFGIQSYDAASNGTARNLLHLSSSNNLIIGGGLLDISTGGNTYIYGKSLRFRIGSSTTGFYMGSNGGITIGNGDTDSAGTAYKLYVKGNTYNNGAFTVTGLATLSGGATIPGTAAAYLQIGQAKITWNSNGYLHIDKPLVTAGDQIVISGTPGGGGGGGGSTTLASLLDVAASFNPSPGKFLVYDSQATNNDGGTGAWKAADGVLSVAGLTGAVTTAQIATALTNAGYKLTDTVYTHPTGGANTTIVAANGKVLSAITVNELGHVTSVASKTLAAADIPSITKSKISDFPTTWALANITGADDLKAIEALVGTSGLLRKTAADEWELDTNAYITGNQTITLSGDVSGSGTTAISVSIGSGKVTNAMLAGSINWSKLLASSIPTTISGYGITDAYISSSAVYIGSNSVGTSSAPIGYSTYAARPKYVVPTQSANAIDLNTILANGGSTKNLWNTSYWNHAPSDASYFGLAWQISPSGTSETGALQFYWDGSYTGSTPTGKIRWRMRNSEQWGDDWHLLYDSASLTKSVVTNLIGSTTYAPYNADGYLPLSGGTMTGDIKMTDGKYIYTTDNYIIVGQNAAGTSFFCGTGYKASSAFILRSGNINLTHRKFTTSSASTDYTIWDAANSNLSTVDWTVNKLYVGTGGSTGDSYVASDAASNIYLRNSSGAVLVAAAKVIRRGTNLSDVTLGSVTYPWGGVFTTDLSASGNITVTGTSTFKDSMYFDNRKYIFWKLADGTTDTNVFGINNYNQLLIGYGMRESYQTMIYGNPVKLNVNNTSIVSVESTGASLVGTLTMDAGNAIRWNNSSSTACTVLSMGSYDYVYLAYGAAGEGSSTYIYGNDIKFHATTSRTLIATIDSTGLSVTGAISASGAGTFDTITLTNATATGHIAFSRASANYITAPASGTINFVPNGLAVGSANSRLGVSDNEVTITKASGAAMLAIQSTSANVASGTIWFRARSTSFNGIKLVGNQGATSNSYDRISLDFMAANGTSSSSVTWKRALRITYGGNLIVGASGATSTFTQYGNMTVNGDITSTGDQTVSSDALLKMNWRPLRYGVKEIAKATAGVFDWIDGHGSSAGTKAQDWVGLVPELVHGKEGCMSLAYGQLALVNTVLIARHETEQDEEINQLKIRVAELEEEVKRLRS